MTETANVISLSDAQKARRKRLSAEARASVAAKDKVAKTPKSRVKATKAQAKAEAKAALQAAMAEDAALKAERNASDKPAKVAKAAKATAPKHVAAPAKASVKASAKVDRAAAAAKAEAKSAKAAAKGAAAGRGTKAAVAATAPKATDRTSRKSGQAEGTRTPKRYVIRDTINNLLARPLVTTAAVFVTVLLLVGVFLYPTARTYYQAIREQARLEAEFSAVLERNTKMAADITFLQTDEGIIQEARETLGWVERGENAVIVYGAGFEERSAVDENIIAAEVKAPATWYSWFLDPFFGVK